VRQSRGWESSAWALREKMQISLDKKAATCQYKVSNSSSAACLREQVRELLEEILGSADRTG